MEQLWAMSGKNTRLSWRENRRNHMRAYPSEPWSKHSTSNACLSQNALQSMSTHLNALSKARKICSAFVRCSDWPFVLLRYLDHQRMQLRYLLYHSTAQSIPISKCLWCTLLGPMIFQMTLCTNWKWQVAICSYPNPDYVTSSEPVYATVSQWMKRVTDSNKLSDSAFWWVSKCTLRYSHRVYTVQHIYKSCKVHVFTTSSAAIQSKLMRRCIRISGGRMSGGECQDYESEGRRSGCGTPMGVHTGCQVRSWTSTIQY